VLLLEFDGSEEDVAESVRRTRVLLEAAGAMSVSATRDPEQRKVLWRGRKGAFGAMGRLAPDLYVQDAVVPGRVSPKCSNAWGRSATPIA
jgi:glycolate oxidase